MRTTFGRPSRRWSITRERVPAAEVERYRAAVPALRSKDVAARAALAGYDGTAAEVLYFLADDAAPEVRRLVAANPSTPVQADDRLCTDADESVRCALARKIGRLVPNLDAGVQHRLYHQAVVVLERLAQDHLPQVRAIVAEEIKHSPNVPHALIRRLAFDVETIVCVPILEYSPLLRDEDLIEVIAAGTALGALQAVARRSGLSNTVAEAVVATVDIPAIAALLANASADIRTETLDHLIAEAEQIRAWHAPLVVRAGLSLRAVRRIAGFVGSALVEELCRHQNLDAETALALATRVRARLREQHFEAPPDDSAAEIEAAIAAGGLTDRMMIDAIVAGRAAFAVQALARLAGVGTDTVGAILASRNGKAVTALVWRAGFSMRVAIKAQQHLAHVPPAKIVHARDGLYFPLSRDEMLLHLELFGIPG